MLSNSIFKSYIYEKEFQELNFSFVVSISTSSS